MVSPIPAQGMVQGAVHQTVQTTSTVFQILQDIQKRQRAIQCQYNSNMVHVHANTSWSGPPAYCAHVHKLPKQDCKPGDSLALRKVQHHSRFQERLLDGSTSSKSRKLTCMALPFGRFQWTGLPMGTVVAQDIFQSKLDSIFIGMEGVTGIADDMVIAGRDKMEHDRNFLAFMEKCMSNNLTLNLEKIQFKQSQVSFYGHCWLKHGISQDPKKIKALNHMEFPLDKETMRSFLG